MGPGHTTRLNQTRPGHTTRLTRPGHTTRLTANNTTQMCPTQASESPNKWHTQRRLPRRQLPKRPVRLPRRIFHGKPLDPRVPILGIGLMVAILGVSFLMDGMVIEDHKFDRRRLVTEAAKRAKRTKQFIAGGS